MPLVFDFSRAGETNEASRTPLGILALFIGMMRQRFTDELSGQTTGFNWTPDPKTTQIYIEKWGSEFAKVENFNPAITLKRAAFQYVQPTFYGLVARNSRFDKDFRLGQMEGGILISCYSRKESECEILSNMVYELFIRGQKIIQKAFEINMCFPQVLTETTHYGDAQMQDTRIYNASIQLRLNFDINSMSFPIAPRLQQIAVFVKEEQNKYAPSVTIPTDPLESS